MSDGPDDAFDERLRAALRHAPDQDALPPPAVSARVLDAARAATAVPARPTAPGPVSRLRGWIASLGGPGPRAAVASLLLAGVIGVMWRDGPPPADDGAREPTASAEDAAAIAAARPSVVSPTPARSPQPPAAVPAPDPAPAPVPRAAPVAPAPEVRRAEAPTPAARPAPPPERPKAGAAERSRSEAPPAPAVAAAPPPAEGAAEPAAPATPATPEGPLAPEAATARADAAADDRPPVPAPAPDPLAVEAARWEQRDVTAADAAAPPAPGRAAEAMRLRGAPAAAVAPASTWPAWLAQARQATAGRWSPSPVGPADGAARTVPGPDGDLDLGRIELQADALLWQARGQGEAWRAPLSPSAAATLRAALPAR